MICNNQEEELKGGDNEQKTSSENGGRNLDFQQILIKEKKYV
jgi:hypothetical protein